jgi:ankyrin repeat protein
LNQGLHLAAGNSQLLVVPLLLEYGADIHSGNDKALQFAARQGDVKMLKLLLERGADVHAEDEEALFQAVTNERPEASELLLRKGAVPLQRIKDATSDQRILRSLKVNRKFSWYHYAGAAFAGALLITLVVVGFGHRRG